jgi:hypothetical protein
VWLKWEALSSNPSTSKKKKSLSEGRAVKAEKKQQRRGGRPEGHRWELRGSKEAREAWAERVQPWRVWLPFLLPEQSQVEPERDSRG